MLFSGKISQKKENPYAHHHPFDPKPFLPRRATRRPKSACPHTWNNLDGQDGEDDGSYWRGIGSYHIALPARTAGCKQYIEFQGANHVATVYCNGRELGTHRGGFSTFRFELTDALTDGENILTVEVTNAPSDVYPQMADFTFFGGLYRAVQFIEVAPAHFDLLKCGTSGVFVTPRASGGVRIDGLPGGGRGLHRQGRAGRRRRAARWPKPKPRPKATPC